MPRFLILFLIALAAGCAARGPAPAGARGVDRFEFTQLHMGVEARIVLYAPDEPAAASAAAAAFARIAALDAGLTDYRTDSELMRLCARAGGSPVHVSDDLFALLTTAAAVAEASGGAFDITVGPLSRLWREARRTGKEPHPAAVAAAKALVNHRNIILDPEARAAQLSTPGMLLDLGGIAKGYAAQEALKVLRDAGRTQALVALAGDIALGDPPPGREGWRVALSAPGLARGAGGSSAPGSLSLTLANTCISTSGDAEQYIVVDGRRVSHIIDPAEGRGSLDRPQATVVCADGALADALATAATLAPEGSFLPMMERFDAAATLVGGGGGVRVLGTPFLPEPPSTVTGHGGRP